MMPSIAMLVAAMIACSSPALAQQRTVVPLAAEEREHVLGEMRDFLVMLERINSALAQGNFDAVAAAARPLGTGGERGRMPPAIAQKLPPAFKTLARSAHEQVDTIATDAGKRDLRQTLEQSARLLQTCNACHAAFEFPK